MRKLILAAVASCAAITVAAAPAAKTYRADDADAVRIVGRTLHHPDGSLSFDWSGVYAETVVDGAKSIDLRASGTGKNYFDVSVDGRHTDKIKIASPDTVIRIAANLTKGRHTVSIRKCTEGETGRTTFHSFTLPQGGSMTATAPRKRHIEVIGNSLTAGFGTDSEDPRAPFTPETENCNYSYSTIVPRYFDADYTLIAHSGRGAVRNYGDSVRISRNAMRHKFLQTFDEDTTIRWDFEDSYRPDLVIINLGANDFSTEPHPYRSEFVNAYCEIIDSVRAKYGEQTKILSVIPYAIAVEQEPMFADIMQRQADKPTYFLRMPVDYLNWDSDRGAVYHPNYRGQKKMAMFMIPYIATIMGWDFPTKPVE